MPPSNEEVHREVLNLLKDWGKDFDEDRYNLIMAPTGQGSEFQIVGDENRVPPRFLGTCTPRSVVLNLSKTACRLGCHSNLKNLANSVVEY
jgi:hypothetical protein